MRCGGVLIVVASAVVLGGCGSAGQDVGAPAGAGVAEPTVGAVEDPTVGATVEAAATVVPVPSATASPRPTSPPPTVTSVPIGTRLNPIPYGLMVEVALDAAVGADRGSQWAIAVGPPQDVTEAVLAENRFNDGPPPRAVFAGFHVSMTLIGGGVEPLAPGRSIRWEILGGVTSTVYDSSTLTFGCGVVPGEWDGGTEVFVGGVVEGLVCIPVPADDLAYDGTQIAGNVHGERIVFGQ